jgi:type IX secretion system PorP/SprF family membrane protein
MRRIATLIFVFMISLSYGQQLPQYSQWSWHQFASNPAHAGIKNCVDIHSLYRMQWVGFEGAPSSGFLTVAIPLGAKRRQYLSARHGLGFKFETDRIGQFSSQRLNVAYAGHFNFNKTNRLSLGIYAGVLQTGYDPSSITTTVPDPSAANESSFVTPDASFGAWFNSTNYYLGFTLQNLIPSKWQSIGTDSRYGFHANLNAGYRLNVKEHFSLLPTIQLKIPPKGPSAVDLILQADYNNMFGFGVGYRNTDALILLIQFKIKEQFSIGYSFDYTLSQIQVGAQNTHEVSLRFTSCKPPRRGTSNCPLFD